MIPIHELLSRIRWDRGFGRGVFAIGYRDRVEQRIIRVPLTRLRFEAGSPFCFQVETETGARVTIPFHRVVQVFRDGTLIWRRSALQ